MSLLRPSVVKQHKPNPNIICSYIFAHGTMNILLVNNSYWLFAIRPLGSSMGASGNAWKSCIQSQPTYSLYWWHITTMMGLQCGPSLYESQECSGPKYSNSVFLKANDFVWESSSTWVKSVQITAGWSCPLKKKVGQTFNCFFVKFKLKVSAVSLCFS